MLTKDLLRVSRAGGRYQPRFAGHEHRPLAARVLGTFHDSVGDTRADVDAAIEDLERDADDFKLVRGFASLLEREATFETQAAIPPERARRAAFEAASAVDVVTEADRERALASAADGLGVDPSALDESLYADRGSRQVFTSFDPRWTPDELIEQYNLSLAQTALFDATAVRIRSSDPKRLVSAVKRLRLLYEIRQTDEGREVVVTGPDALFRQTRRYGTSFARLLRTVAKSEEWRLAATVDDRGTEREMVLTSADVSVPGVEPITEPTYDSGVEADFAARFEGLGLDWNLVREPEPLEAGTTVMIPDFAFDYAHADFRVFFEIMGFWTPEYVEKKLGKLDAVSGVELLVAVDESLGAGDDVEARDHRAIPYRDTVRVKDVVDVLREYEATLVADAAASIPDGLVPDADVITLESLAEAYGVSEDAIEGKRFPEHRRVGRTLVRDDVLDALADELDAGMSLAEAESHTGARGIDDASAVLSELGYRVEWEGLTGGTLSPK